MSKKIDEKDLERLKKQESAKSRVLSDIGTVEAQKHELLHAFAELVGESRKINEELEEKYGKITVNLQDGTYEEIKSEEDVQAN